MGQPEQKPIEIEVQVETLEAHAENPITQIGIGTAVALIAGASAEFFRRWRKRRRS